LGTQASVIYWDTPWAIDSEETFLPQNLKDVGYRTALFGKWHLGMFQEKAQPRSRGFDEHMGFFQGCGGKMTHVASCCHANDPANETGNKDFVCSAKGSKDYRGWDWFKSGSEGGASEADITANHTSSAALIGQAAVEFIERIAPSNDPFFLFLPFQNIHGPYTVEERYRDLYKDSDITDMEMTMWGYISEMDEQVGNVIAALKGVPGAYENSVIVFSSDNGAPNVKDVDDRNYPYQGFKASIWEGGVRVPGFVHSPMLPASVRGTVSQELYHVTDWLPTLVEVAGGDTTRNRPLDGHSIWESISTGSASPRKEVIYNVNPLCDAGQASPPKAGIRMEKWKLLSWCYSIAGIDGKNTTGPVSAPAGKHPEFENGPVLFDLEADPSEMTNVAAKHPDVVEELLARLKVWAESSVEPMQWTAPYQGKNYFCKDCPLHPAGKGPDVPWSAWISNAGVPLALPLQSASFQDHATLVV
jgi:arylsulfatase A-like enzyme